MQYFEGLDFFIILGLMLIPIIVLRLLKKPVYWASLVFSILFAVFIYREHPKSLLGLLTFLGESYVLVRLGFFLREKKTTVYMLVTAASLLLIVTKVLLVWRVHFIGFLGISYMTFKVIQIILETYDGIIKEPVGIVDYLHFLLFFPTISSGPIDRSRRFMEDSHQILERTDYLEMAGTGVWRFCLGVLYKVVLSGIIFDQMNHLPSAGIVITTILYMYCYSFYLFFDFAGYSLMAVGISNLMGIDTPMNFNQPFRSIDIKDFWNRWHITLSTWLRDFVFSRLVMRFMRKKRFKTRLTTAMVAYLLNMALMGVWHGLTISYIIYGLYHGLLMAVFEFYQKKSQFYKKNKTKTWYKVLSWFITIHLVMLGLLIFSGKPYNYVIKIFMKS